MHKILIYMTVGVLVGMLILAPAWGAVSAHHQFLGGPWEVLAKMGFKGQGVHVPVSVTDEQKPQSLDLPVTLNDSPVRVRLTRYLPDLRQKIVAVSDPNGADVVHLSLAGDNLQQSDLWLSARDPAHRSITSSIGGIQVIQLERSMAAGSLKTLTRSSTVGVLTLWLPGQVEPLETVVGPRTRITLPNGQGQLRVLDYMPHYTIDRKTKKVVNASSDPVNPALKVHLTYHGKDTQQWIWAKFPHTPHGPLDLPLRMRYHDYFPPAAGFYILTTTPDHRAWLYYRKGRRLRWEAIQPGQRFPFKNKQHTFALQEIRSPARIETQWVNQAEILRRPAVIATLQRGSNHQDVALQLGQPFHFPTDQGTVVLLFRRIPGTQQ